MNADHERFAEWDAAYVLGALSSADRAAFEAHLVECERCRAAIADLAPIVGLLSRVEPDRGRGLIEAERVSDGPDAARRAQLVALGARRSRRRRRAGVAVVAALAAVLVAVPVVVTVTQPQSTVVAMAPVGSAPLEASVELTEVAWGTRIDMTCAYGHGPSDREWRYTLVVTAADGTESALSTWRATAGSTARLSAGTALAPDEIASIDIRSSTTGDVLMRAAPLKGK
ncbi:MULTISPECIES: zf-HC2 domain-containing protein [Microbacterium]|uniref:zf-HC2 domain-containing protein n=1 Tax=Microbacterium TaxID=33882 RepID=UPI0024AECD9E|nr:zf-HC2 domain-containing protein [Microbacterium barkeri]MDI6943993.1 zf-HC2 domain-containing protein [Microbacterium barkeri]